MKNDKTARVLSIGEVLWDVFDTGELLGGAPLNFCYHLHRLGEEAELLAAVGDDLRGRRVLQSMQRLGLSTRFVHSTTERPTGIAEITTNQRGEAAFSIPRPAAFDCLLVDAAQRGHLLAMEFNWIYFGTLLHTNPRVQAQTLELLHGLPNARRFYDMNLRTGHWSLPLVERLCHQATVLKLNDVEAHTLWNLHLGPGKVFSMEEFCRYWTNEFALDAICVTEGERGCSVRSNGRLLRAAGHKVVVADTVGSGDAFAAAFLHGYHQGWPMERTMRMANALGALVASRAGATPPWTLDECEAMAQRAE